MFFVGECVDVAAAVYVVWVVVDDDDDDDDDDAVIWVATAVANVADSDVIAADVFVVVAADVADDATVAFINNGVAFVEISCVLFPV